jgi:predicted RNA binding protein YcfA (HicA-like mRNA interferase family)
MDSGRVIRALRDAGWRLDRVRGSHHIFRHPDKPGTVVVPHPRKDLPIGTLRQIEMRAGLRLRS